GRGGRRRIGLEQARIPARIHAAQIRQRRARALDGADVHRAAQPVKEPPAAREDERHEGIAGKLEKTHLWATGPQYSGAGRRNRRSARPLRTNAGKIASSMSSIDLTHHFLIAMPNMADPYFSR